jgi:hypothetical protein
MTTKKPRKRSVSNAKPANLSALNAAARVLATADESMGCRELIEVMAVKGLWKSPGGKTPWATLHSAIAREITGKGKQSRFRKDEHGKFALKAR